MSGQDLPVSPLPLTEQLRAELDASILEEQGPLVKRLPNSGVSEMARFIACLMSMTGDIFEREGQKNALKDMSAKGVAQILEQQHEVRGVVLALCQESKFSKILDLKTFQNHTSTNPSKSQERDESGGDELSISFKRSYIGGAVDSFFRYLTLNNQKFREGHLRKYYGKYCSIVQSSGTGKSRLLLQLRDKEVLVLYMNLHGPGGTIYPRRDDIPSRILTENLDCSQSEYTARCCAFFAAIFTTLETKLSALMTTHHNNTTAVINAWNDQMCNVESIYRKKFFADVANLSKMNYDTIRAQETSVQVTFDGAQGTSVRMTFDGTGVEKAGHSQSRKRARTESSDDVHAEGPAAGVEQTARRTTLEVEDPHLEGESLLRRSYKDMLKSLPTLFPLTRDEPRLVIGIDEAHSLSHRGDGQRFRPSHILCRIINAYSRDGRGQVWVAYASTITKIADFSAPQPIHDSMRIAAAGRLLFPPFTHLGWDQNADSLVHVEANQVAKFDHIIGFGRPLWKSLVDDADSAITVASQKLCKATTHDITEPMDILSILSQRFGLDICFGHPDAVSHTEEGIASHLRVCYSTTLDRTWSFTGYPSEPLLSCAAADRLHHGSNLVNALRVLKDRANTGMFEIGQSGELASRLLLLLAKDLYVRKYISTEAFTLSNTSEVLTDCQSVPIIDFLQYLFGNSFWSQAGEVAKEEFKHAYINFSHWISMDGLVAPGPDSKRLPAAEWTLRLWHRTAAVQCCHLQPLIDKVIPVYFDDPNDESPDLECVSQLLVSDKAGKNPNKQTLQFITRRHHTIDCASPRPFIALLLDLGVQSGELDVTFPERESNHEGRCLRIYAPRLCQATFPFLPEEIESHLLGLLSKPVPPLTDSRSGELMRCGSTSEEPHWLWELQK